MANGDANEQDTRPEYRKIYAVTDMVAITAAAANYFRSQQGDPEGPVEEKDLNEIKETSPDFVSEYLQTDDSKINLPVTWKVDFKNGAIGDLSAQSDAGLQFMWNELQGYQTIPGMMIAGQEQPQIDKAIVDQLVEEARQKIQEPYQQFKLTEQITAAQTLTKAEELERGPSEFFGEDKYEKAGAKVDKLNELAEAQGDSTRYVVDALASGGVGWTLAPPETLSFENSVEGRAAAQQAVSAFQQNFPDLGYEAYTDTQTGKILIREIVPETPEFDVSQGVYGGGTEGRTRAQNALDMLEPSLQDQFQVDYDPGQASYVLRRKDDDTATTLTGRIDQLALEGRLDEAEQLDIIRDKLNQKRMTQTEAASIVGQYATSPDEFATWMRGLIAGSGQPLSPSLAAATQAGQPGLFQTGQTSIVSDEVRALGEARLNAKEKYIQDQIDKGATPAEIDAIRKTPGTQLPLDQYLSLQPKSAAEVFTTGPFAQTMAEPGERMEGDPLIMGSGDRPTTVFKDPSMGTGVAPQSGLLTYDPYYKKSLIMDENILASMPTAFDTLNKRRQRAGLSYITKGKGGAPGYTFVPNAAKILAKTQSQVVKELMDQGATQAEIKAAQVLYKTPGGKKTKYNPAASTKERIQGLMDEFGYTKSQAQQYDFEQGKRRYKMQQSYQQQGPMRVRYG